MDKLINNISRTIKKTNTLKNCTDFVKNYKSTDYKKFIEFSDVKYKCLLYVGLLIKAHQSTIIVKKDVYLKF